MTGCVIVLAVFVARVDQFDRAGKLSDFRFGFGLGGRGGQRSVDVSRAAHLRFEIRKTHPSGYEKSEEDGQRQKFIYDQQRMGIA
jgi:hypothetical protein